MTGNFEDALAGSERDARATQLAAETTVRVAKRLVAATATGDVTAITKALADADQAVNALAMQLRNAQEGWSFDVAEYARSGQLTEEIREAAGEAGLTIHEQDGRLFCYPALLRVIEADPAIEIDRKRFRTIRPSHIVRQLEKLRNRPARFRPDQFLESLFNAYEWARKGMPGQSRRLDGRGPVIELASLFDLLTLFPEVRRGYDRAEFTRDLYLLDRARTVQTRSGARAEFSASTGTKGTASRVFQIIGEDGARKDYYGIAFTGGGS